MHVTLQIDKATGHVFAVTETYAPLVGKEPNAGVEFYEVTDEYGKAAKTCGCFHDKASGKFYSNAAKTVDTGMTVQKK